MKFLLFLPASWQGKSAGISKLLVIRLVPSFKLKTKHLYVRNYVHRYISRPRAIKGRKYYLKITPKGFSYNLEVNTCWLQGWEFNDNELTTESIPCTRVCCDDRYGRTYEYLNYTGTYQLDETHKRLTILGSNGITKLVLVRTEKTTW